MVVKNNMNIFYTILNCFKSGNKYDLEWFFDAAFEGIAISKKGRFIDGNDRFINMFGYSRKEMINMPISKFVYKDDQDLVSNNIKNNYTKPYEHRCIHRDGSIRHVEVHGHQVSYQGSVVRVTAIHDITIQKENEYRLKFFYENAFEGIVIHDGDKIIDCNNYVCSMVGMSYDEIINLKLLTMVFEEDRPIVTKNIKENYKKFYEFRLYHKNGSIRYVEVCGRIIQYRGNLSRIAVIHDITDRKKHEEEIRKLNFRQSQISKMEAIGSFAEGIAHDFNNALQPIIGNCDLIIQDMDNSRDKCKRHYKKLMAVLEAAEMAKLFIRKIHDFTRKDESTKKIKSLDLTYCFQETFDFLRSMISKSIRMEMNIDDELYFVKVDDTTIKQILMNLCTNSSQAMPNRRGTISISVNNREVVSEECELPKGKYVRIRIKDDGMGMTPEIMKRAFDPYFTTKEIEEGTGIGLSVVNKIILDYNGYIDIDSEVNKGTEVSIYIPAAE